jgi:hypothetical protein
MPQIQRHADASNIVQVIHPDSDYTALRVLLQKFFGFIDLRGQVRAAATIRMVQHHECSMILADLFFGKIALAGFR